MKRAIALLTAVVLLLTLSGCGQKASYKDVPNPIATITMEDGSVMRFELDLQNAPNTAVNFTTLANKGFYDGLCFYRIIPGVLSEAGSPTNDGRGNAGYTIKGEFAKNNYYDNQLSHMRGTLSMATQSGDYDSASCIFFIMQGNYPEYDGSYAAFGTALDNETLAAIDALGKTPVDGNYSPYSPQTIASIRVNTHGYDLKPEKLSLGSGKKRRKIIEKATASKASEETDKQEEKEEEP